MTSTERDRGRKRVLLVSYAYPPVGGAGVQRPLKFSKYLPAFGWDVTVLTVSNPSVPVLDASLLDEIPNEVKVLRAKTWEPSYRAKRVVSASGDTQRTGWLPWIKQQVRQFASQWLVPDPQILWNRQAYREGWRYASRIPHDAILVSGPPFSSFQLGEQLARRLDLPLILDFRDEWMLSIRHLENHQRGQRGFQQQRLQFERALRSSCGVIATTQRSAESLRIAMQKAGGSAPAATIYNGFDPDDLTCPPRAYPKAESNDDSEAPRHATLSATSEPHPNTCLRLLYMGTLWGLTDATPCVEGLAELAKQTPDLARHLSMKWIGRRTPEQDTVLQRLEPSRFGGLEIHDYLPHDQALEQARHADISLLFLADREGAERVVPGKLFEYFALGKTILAIVPEGECRDLMLQQAAECPDLQHGCFAPSETEEIVRWLQSQVRRHHANGSRPDTIAFANHEAWYARPQQAKQLAHLLDLWSANSIPLAKAG